MAKWVVANWKMNGDLTLVKSYLENFGAAKNLIVAPPFAYLDRLAPISTAAQNVAGESHGAYTGEVSARQLGDIGVRFCLVGHSERHSLFGETDAMVKRKAALCVQNGIMPIICAGESLNDRVNQNTRSVLKERLAARVPESGDFWIAYEPLWAIGSGKTPSIEEIGDTLGFVKSEAPSGVRVLYGGSVKGANVAPIVELPEVDGVLVGGACLDIGETRRIMEAATAAGEN